MWILWSEEYKQKQGATFQKDKLVSTNGGGGGEVLWKLKENDDSKETNNDWLAWVPMSDTWVSLSATWVTFLALVCI